MAFLNAATIFIIVPVDNVVATVLDAPVFTVVAKHLCGAGLGGRLAGDSIGDVTALPAAFFVQRDAFHHERLPDVGKLQVVIEGTSDPDIARLDTTMIRTVEGAVIGFTLEMVKIEGGLFKQIFLIRLDREVVMGVPILNQITGQFTLGQQGVGSDGFSEYK